MGTWVWTFSVHVKRWEQEIDASNPSAGVIKNFMVLLASQSSQNGKLQVKKKHTSLESKLENGWGTCLASTGGFHMHKHMYLNLFPHMHNMLNTFIHIKEYYSQLHLFWVHRWNWGFTKFFQSLRIYEQRRNFVMGIRVSYV